MIHRIGLELLREIYFSESDWQMRHTSLHECKFSVTFNADFGQLG